jgi:dUTP pyrophosphatase
MRYYSERQQLTKKHDEDAGLDIMSAERVTILPLSSVVISTGLFLEIPFGHVGLIWSRSGLSCNHDIEVGAGCLDSSYRGEVKVHLYNHSKDHAYNVEYGDKIAQLLTVPIRTKRYESVESKEDLGITERGEKGFGSSGY